MIIWVEFCVFFILLLFDLIYLKVEELYDGLENWRINVNIIYILFVKKVILYGKMKLLIMLFF